MIYVPHDSAKKKVHEVVVKLCAERPIRSKIRLAYECQLRIYASLTPIMGTKKGKKSKERKKNSQPSSK